MNKPAPRNDFTNAMRVCLDELNMAAWASMQADSYRATALDFRARAHRALRRGDAVFFRHTIREAIRHWSLHKSYVRKARQHL
jgi:hypothetical protein